MANPSTAHEPSMEEILASIRQIISEDGEASTAARADTDTEANAEGPGAENPKSAAAESEPSVARAEVAPAKGDAMKPQTFGSPARPAQQQTSPIASSAAAGETLSRPEVEPGASGARPPQAAQRTSRALEE